MKRFLVIVLLALSCRAQAGEFKSFDLGGRVAIERSHAGKPFILALWSIDCPYCMEDLKVLGELVRQHPDIALVTVCTNGRESAAEAAKVLDKAGLPPHERWQFAFPDEDRLRYDVDKSWYGELPRSYFYDTAHRIQALSGRPQAAWLVRWLQDIKQ